MTDERAAYSYSSVYKCCELVKGLNITCKCKCEHFAIACELEKAAYYCYDNTGDYNFHPKYTPIDTYRLVAYYQNCTKKELDTKARHALRFLQNELNSLLTMMKTGEVNAID